MDDYDFDLAEDLNDFKFDAEEDFNFDDILNQGNQSADSGYDTTTHVRESNDIALIDSVLDEIDTAVGFEVEFQSVGMEENTSDHMFNERDDVKNTGVVKLSGGSSIGSSRASSRTVSVESSRVGSRAGSRGGSVNLSGEEIAQLRAQLNQATSTITQLKDHERQDKLNITVLQAKLREVSNSKNETEKLKETVSQLKDELKCQQEISRGHRAQEQQYKMDMVRLKKGLKQLNERNKLLEKQRPTSDSAALNRSEEELRIAKHQLVKSQEELSYARAQTQALQETLNDFAASGFNAGGSGEEGARILELEAEVSTLNEENEKHKRRILALGAEKKIAEEQLDALKVDFERGGSSSSHGNQLRVRVVELEAALKEQDLQKRKLVSAIKADRNNRHREVADLLQERDEQEARAEKVEAKLLQLIDLIRTERLDHHQKIQEMRSNDKQQQAILIARKAIREAEQRIELANQEADRAEDELELTRQELEKERQCTRRQHREVENAQEEIAAMEQRFNRLLDATKRLKSENQMLKSGARISMLPNGPGGAGEIGVAAEEFASTLERSSKLEAACRKLRQMLKDQKEEFDEISKEQERRLLRAEEKILMMEERESARASSSALPPLVGGSRPPPPPPGGGPPPPPPPPNLKLKYDIKINRTGQANNIKGGPENRGKAQGGGNANIDSIVDAIKKGVTLRKTGRSTVGEFSNSAAIASGVANSLNGGHDESDMFGLAAMAQELVLDKKRREIEKEQKDIVAATKHKLKPKDGGELDNLLAELEDLADL